MRISSEGAFDAFSSSSFSFFSPLLSALKLKNDTRADFNAVSLATDKQNFLRTNQTKLTSLYFQFDITPKRDVSVTFTGKRDLSATAQSAPLCSWCAKLWSHGKYTMYRNPWHGSKTNADGTTASPSRSRRPFTAKKGTFSFFPPGPLQSLDGVYVLLFWVTGTWTPFCPVAMDTAEWEREPLWRCLKKKNNEEIKVAAQIQVDWSLTQFVLLLSFGSLFGIKVPDCDGVSATQGGWKMSDSRWSLSLIRNRYVLTVMLWNILTQG